MGAEYGVRVAAVNELGEGQPAALAAPVRVALPYSTRHAIHSMRASIAILQYSILQYSTVSSIRFLLVLVSTVSITVMYEYM